MVKKLKNLILTGIVIGAGILNSLGCGLPIERKALESHITESTIGRYAGETAAASVMKSYESTIGSQAGIVAADNVMKAYESTRPSEPSGGIPNGFGGGYTSF